MQTEPSEDVIFHAALRELKTVRRGDRTTETDTRGDESTHIEPEELHETRQEYRTPWKRTLESRTNTEEPFMSTHTEPDEPHRTTRREHQMAEKDRRSRKDITNCPSLTPIGSCFSGVPDVKGLVVTDVDVGKKKRKKEGRIIEKRVFVYGMGLQVFDVAVGDTLR